MNKPRKNVRYHPPANDVIDHYAEKVCTTLGIQQADMIQELGCFMKLVARITSQHLNEQNQEVLDSEAK